MDPKQHTCASICDRLPTLSANHPWLFDHNLKKLDDDDYDTTDHIFYTTHDPTPSQYRFRLPSLPGRRIRGCFHGWVILSNHPHNDMWSLWNPKTTCNMIIRLPRLSLRNRDLGLDLTQQCCLSSPPGHHGSIFMLTTKYYAIVFCRLDSDNNRRLKWAGMPYAKQMRRITGGYDSLLYNLTCCNGKVYSLHTRCSEYFIIHIDIVVKGAKIVITLLPCFKVLRHSMNGCASVIPFLKGCCTELFYIRLGRNEVGRVTDKIASGVCVIKLDMKNMTWEEMEDLKGATFFLDLAHGYSVFYSPAIASELGGYAHFLGISGKVIHSFDSSNKTIALSSMSTSHASLSSSEHRLPHREMIKSLDTKSRLLNLPFDVLKTIMECCVGVEYLNFRATCKQCHLAAPMIRWGKAQRILLQTYSLPSPWLMVIHKDRGVISFTDPVFGGEYFIKTPRELIGDLQILYSMCGWLLIRRRRGEPLMFFNPFTSDIRELPYAPYFETCSFSASPTSSDCMVVGFSIHLGWHVHIHYVAREPSWRRFRLNFFDDCLLHSIRFATLIYAGLNLYALYNNGRIDFIDTDNEGYTWREGPRSSCESPNQNFLMKLCDQQLLLVMVGDFGEAVEVFKLNGSTGWEKTESLGRHMIYIGGKTCLCIEAKTPAMANKIYFARMHSGNNKIVFYSLESRRYHTCDNEEESFGDFLGTKHPVDPHAWIEPSWL